MSVMRTWAQDHGDQLIITLHVQPGAARSEVAGVHGDALKIRLDAPPVGGRANDALIEFLATAFGVPKRQVALLSGRSSRRKRVRITGATRRPDMAW